MLQTLRPGILSLWKYPPCSFRPLSHSSCHPSASNASIHAHPLCYISDSLCLMIIKQTINPKGSKKFTKPFVRISFSRSLDLRSDWWLRCTMAPNTVVIPSSHSSHGQWHFVNPTGNHRFPVSLHQFISQKDPCKSLNKDHINIKERLLQALVKEPSRQLRFVQTAQGHRKAMSFAVWNFPIRQPCLSSASRDGSSHWGARRWVGF